MELGAGSRGKQGFPVILPLTAGVWLGNTLLYAYARCSGQASDNHGKYGRLDRIRRILQSACTCTFHHPVPIYGGRYGEVLQLDACRMLEGSDYLALERCYWRFWNSRSITGKKTTLMVTSVVKTQIHTTESLRGWGHARLRGH